MHLVKSLLSRLGHVHVLLLQTLLVTHLVSITVSNISLYSLRKIWLVISSVNFHLLEDSTLILETNKWSVGKLVSW